MIPERLYLGKTNAMGSMHIVGEKTILEAEPGDRMASLCNAQVTSIFVNNDKLPVTYSGPVMDDPRVCKNCKHHYAKLSS